MAMGPLSCAGFALGFGSMGAYLTLLLIGRSNGWLTIATMAGFVAGLVLSTIIGSARDHSNFYRASIEQGALSRPRPLVETPSARYDRSHEKRDS